MAKKNGVSQRRLARGVGVDVRTIERYESNQCKSHKSTLERINEFCKVDFASVNSEDELLWGQPLKPWIDAEKDYYVIWGNQFKYGGYTEFAGYVDESCEEEMRVLRHVNGLGFYKHNPYVQAGIKLQVINNELDSRLFAIVGGIALIRADVCEKYLPEYCKPYICKCG